MPSRSLASWIIAASLVVLPQVLPAQTCMGGLDFAPTPRTLA